MISLEDLLWGDIELPEENGQCDPTKGDGETIMICCGGAGGGGVVFPPPGGGTPSTFGSSCK